MNLSLPMLEVVSEPESTIGSVYTWFVDPALLGIDLKPLFGRSGLMLKVFKHSVPENPLDFKWGGRRREGWDESPLVDCTIVQNLFASHELAPRVYGLIVLRSPTRDYIAQVTDAVDGAIGQRFSSVDSEKAKHLMAEWGITGCFRGATRNDWIGGQFVDFQCCQLDHDAYESALRERHDEATRWRGSKGKAYQAIPVLRLSGARDAKMRALDMALDSAVDFTGKTVLDLGCSSGAIMREVSDRGAIRVVGVDLPVAAQFGLAVSNYLGYWNQDFLGVDLTLESSVDVVRQKSDIDTFDVVFFLSMNRVCEYSSQIAALSSKYFFLECHPGQSKMEWKARLDTDFSTVKYLGESIDHHNRHLFLAER